MFEYVFTDGKEIKINTENFCKDFQEIKQEFLKNTAECHHRRSTYPNGFIIEMEQYSSKIIVRTNWELIENKDGSFNVIQP